MLNTALKFRVLLIPLALAIELAGLFIAYAISFLLVMGGFISAVLEALNMTLIKISNDLPYITWYLEGWSKNNKHGKQTDNR